MRHFTDTAGRTWLLRADVAAARRVRAVAGLDLLAPDVAAHVGAAVADPLRLADVLYAACLPQADARGLARPDFDRGLAGRTLDAAAAAFVDAANDALPTADDLGPPAPREEPADAAPDLWRTVHRLAARAGVDPSGFTLRELVWAAEGAGRDAWDHTAFTVAGIANQMPFRGKARPLDPAKLNPYTAGAQPAAPKPQPPAKVGAWALRPLFCRK